MDSFPPPDPDRLPKPSDTERAAVGLERWRDAADGIGDSELSGYATRLAAEPAGRALLEAVFGNSPFLSQCMIVDPPFVRSLIEDGPDASLAAILESVATLDGPDARTADVMSGLRRARRRAALTIALADIAGAWPLERVTGALTGFAEAVLGAASRTLLREAAAAGAFTLADPERVEPGSGFIILGMGKLGARELNYSSDVDLILLFDRDSIDTANADGLQSHFTRLARNLGRMLSERTRDGYVFRTDLRLRPDPGATPPAISTLAAETYYESMGQNWERAAFIKARCVAGDRRAGAAFLRNLVPFIWRKHLDFAALRDIHSIKRQIMAQRGGHDIAVAGHNIKLGRGGIREIELFAQTQQLIWGGRDAGLRDSATCDGLRALAAAGHARAETAERLISAYRFLRRVEHRLQMIDDEQTHTLPTDEPGIEALARFLGHDDGAAFRDELLGHLRAVEGHYAELFEEAPALGGPGNLVFTGGDHDPDTLATIETLGFSDPEAVSSLIRAWHHGRYRAMRSTRARELLTELTPALLDALAKTASPSVAFVKFDEFLARLPAGVPLFSLFHANPGLLTLVTEIMGDAPRLADHLSRHAAVLDAVLSAGFFDPPPPAKALEEDLAAALEQARDFQDVLDITRRWANDRKFQVGVQMLRGSIAAEAAGGALSDVAEATIRALMPAVESALAARHGRVPGGGVAVVALGKLGGREMTMSSDLDLLFVYDAPADAEASDGAKPLAPGHYFSRSSQRFLNAITALTGEGRLYEVDMRLRPSGHAGPIASSLEAFVRYHAENAWAWEHMALTRARVVAGGSALAGRVRGAIDAVLTRRRDPDRLLREVADMRARMVRERPPLSPWDVKHLSGGLVDIEFIAQYLELRHADAHPEVLSPSTGEALDRLAAAGCLDERAAGELGEALALWRRVQGMLRLTVEGAFVEERATEGLRAALARYAGSPDFEALKRRMSAVAERASAHFGALVAEPGAALGAAPKPDPRTEHRA